MQINKQFYLASQVKSSIFETCFKTAPQAIVRGERTVSRRTTEREPRVSRGILHGGPNKRKHKSEGIKASCLFLLT